MATLVLTAIGSAIGGPAGGAIGSILGQQIDRALFAPKSREGPRLKELDVQTSSYGTSIPAIFGVMRAAGTVIWATDLVERRIKNGSGKGRPATVNYSYSVSMAVAISSRPLARIGRIWADGNLLRGENGDLKVDGELRIYQGYDNQHCDPLMASAEATGQCSAHRGLAYAVFEDLQLADFGNRIPSLTFEIFEREDPVPVAAIFEAASGGLIVGSSSQAVMGYALSGADARDGLAPLIDVFSLDMSCRDGQLLIADVNSVAALPSPLVPVYLDDNRQFDAPLQKREPASLASRSVSLRYYDKTRDFQAGIQRSERGNNSRTSMQIELAAVLSASEAKMLAEHYNLGIHCDRSTWNAQVSLSRQRLFVGDRFVEPSGVTWRIEQIEHGLGSLAISARLAPDIGARTLAVDPGRGLPAPDIGAGQTRIAIIDLPVFNLSDPARQQIAVFAAGTGRGWRRAALSLTDGDALNDIGPTALPAVMGNAVSILTAHNNLFVDRTSSLEVQLLNTGMDIAEMDMSVSSANAPFFWLQGEFIRFGRCTALGGARFRLSHFQRGCFGSDAYAANHLVGDRFVLLDADSARLLDGPDKDPGTIITVEALGIADDVPAIASLSVSALATTPLSPVHGTAFRSSDGDLSLAWKRRSRIDFGWRDGVDQPLVEDVERYHVTMLSDGVPVSEWALNEPALLIPSAELFQLAGLGNEIVLSIRHVGNHSVSAPHFVAVT